MHVHARLWPHFLTHPLQTRHTASRSPLPAQQLKAGASVTDAMAGMMSLAEGLSPITGAKARGGSSSSKVSITPSRSPVRSWCNNMRRGGADVSTAGASDD